MDHFLLAQNAASDFEFFKQLFNYGLPTTLLAIFLFMVYRLSLKVGEILWGVLFKEETGFISKIQTEHLKFLKKLEETLDLTQSTNTKNSASLSEVVSAMSKIIEFSASTKVTSRNQTEATIEIAEMICEIGAKLSIDLSGSVERIKRSLSNKAE
jgi:hypothetical protein